MHTIKNFPVSVKTPLFENHCRRALWFSTYSGGVSSTSSVVVPSFYQAFQNYVWNMLQEDVLLYLFTVIIFHYIDSFRTSQASCYKLNTTLSLTKSFQFKTVSLWNTPQVQNWMFSRIAFRQSTCLIEFSPSAKQLRTPSQRWMGRGFFLMVLPAQINEENGKLWRWLCFRKATVCLFTVYLVGCSLCRYYLVVKRCKRRHFGRRGAAADRISSVLSCLFSQTLNCFSALLPRALRGRQMKLINSLAHHLGLVRALFIFLFLLALIASVTCSWGCKCGIIKRV